MKKLICATFAAMTLVTVVAAPASAIDDRHRTGCVNYWDCHPRPT